MNTCLLFFFFLLPFSSCIKDTPLHQSYRTLWAWPEEFPQGGRRAVKELADLIPPPDARQEVPQDDRHQVLYAHMRLRTAGRAQEIEGGEGAHDRPNGVLDSHATRGHQRVAQLLLEGQGRAVERLEDELVVAVRRVPVDGVVPMGRAAEPGETLVQIRLLGDGVVVGSPGVRSSAICESFNGTLCG